MIQREIQSSINESMQQFPAVGILGPRQIGKTTLALQIAQALSPEPIYLDLESPTDLEKLKEPEFYFEEYKDRPITLDEVQRTPQVSKLPAQTRLQKNTLELQKTNIFP
jgi:uncharacterized protein